MSLSQKIFLCLLPFAVVIPLLSAFLVQSAAEKAVLDQADKQIHRALDDLSRLARSNHELAQDALIGELAVLRYLLGTRGSPEVRDGRLVLRKQDQITLLDDNSTLVDQLRSLTGSRATIFQVVGDRAIRVSTNVTDPAGDRALGTVVSDPVFEAVVGRGSSFFGIADVVGAPYMTAYEPLRGPEGRIIGILFVGVPQQSLIAPLLLQLDPSRAASSGRMYVIDSKGETVPLFAGAAGVATPDARTVSAIVEDAMRRDTVRGPRRVREEARRRVWYVAVPELDWILAADFDPDASIASLGLPRYVQISLVAAISAFFVLIALFLRRLIHHPTRILLEGSRFLRERNFLDAAARFGSLASRPVSQNEFAQIAQAMTSTAESLAASDAVIEAGQARLQALLNHSSDGIHILTIDGAVQECSPSFARMLGYTREEVLGLNLRDWEVATPAERLTDELRSLLHTPRIFETRHRRKDGSEYDAEVNAGAIVLDGREYVYASVRDVSERRARQLELEELKDRYLRFFESSTSIKLVVDPESGAIVQANGPAVAFYGYTREQLTSLNIADINMASPESVAAEHLKAQEEEREYLEFRHRLASGEVRDVEVYSGPVEVHGRSLTYSVIHDVTRDRRQEIELNQERQRLAAILDGTSAGAWEWNIRTDEVRVSGRWAEILGYRRDELVPLNGERWDAMCHPDDISAARRHAERHIDGLASSYQCVCRMRHKRGHWVWVEESGRLLVPEDGGEPEWMYGAQLDVSPLKAREEQLRLAYEKLEAIASATNAGVLSLSAAGRIDYLSPRFTRLLGYELKDMSDLGAWVSRAAVDDPGRTLLQTVLLGKPTTSSIVPLPHNRNIKLLGRNGGVRSLAFSAKRVAELTVATFSDVTQQTQREELARFQAKHDTLTGLPDRTMLAERIEWHLRQSRRGRFLVCVGFLDLDGFKTVNDECGHEAGDMVLKTTARRLRKTLREADTAARLGGDEFAIVLTEVLSPDSCAPVLNRILEAVRAPIPFEGRELAVSCSLGVTFYTAGSEMGADQLLRQADQAMYDAKVSGKDRIVVFDAKSRDVQKTAPDPQLQCIEAAITQDEFLLYYQPQLNVETGEVVGVEALLRWQPASGDLLAPASFLPRIYDHSLSIAVGRWVMGQAFADAEFFRSYGYRFALSFNVFPMHLVDPDFVPGLVRELDAHPGIDPSTMEIELVETAALNDLERAAEVLGASLELGIGTALDDFGTGFSSLAHVKHLPVSKLKIDKSFIDDILTSAEDVAIVKGALGLARAFDLCVVAEGVEKKAQVARLRSLGCDIIQGYVVAEPMPADRLLVWLDDYYGKYSAPVSGALRLADLN